MLGTQFGITGGTPYIVSLASNEVITGAYVGYAYFPDLGNIFLCYLKFVSNQNTYGPYDAGCSGTTTYYYSLSSGLAFINGNGGWCIGGVTFNYYE